MGQSQEKYNLRDLGETLIYNLQSVIEVFRTANGRDPAYGSHSRVMPRCVFEMCIYLTATTRKNGVSPDGAMVAEQQMTNHQYFQFKLMAHGPCQLAGVDSQKRNSLPLE